MKIKDKKDQMELWSEFEKEIDSRNGSINEMSIGQWTRFALWSIFKGHKAIYFAVAITKGMATPIAWMYAKRYWKKEILSILKGWGWE